MKRGDGRKDCRESNWKDCGKAGGGGVCVYVNCRWCTDITVYDQYCDENIEHLPRSGPSTYRASLRKFVISVYYVHRALPSIRTGKTVGPDKINSNVLKLCKEPLAPSQCKFFHQSRKNDYRPVTLTSIMMNCLEKIVKAKLCDQIKQLTFPF